MYSDVPGRWVSMWRSGMKRRKFFSFSVIWMSSHSTFVLCFLLPCKTGLAIPAMNLHAHNFNAQLEIYDAFTYMVVT